MLNRTNSTGIGGPALDAADAASLVAADIAEVGLMTRTLAGRYEGIFGHFRTVLLQRLKASETMADAAWDAMALTEAATASFRSSFPNQPTYACQSGCAACCHLFVAVPPGVAAAVADHVVANFTTAQREGLQARLVTAAEAARSAEDPTALRLRCPLLGDDDRCTVYEVRPLSCRAFTSTSLPRCQQMVFGPSADARGVDQNPAQYRIHMEATVALQETARLRGLPAEQRGLASALLEALPTG